MDGDLIWGGEHTIECTDDVLWNCVLETHIIFLTSVTPINSIKRKKRKGKIVYDLFKIFKFSTFFSYIF